jgi:hypothetical protein
VEVAAVRPIPVDVRNELDPSDPLDAVILAGMRSKATPVAEGVLAHVIVRRKWTEVRAVIADTPRRPGAVGAWLDTLPADRKVVVPAVLSRRLAEMLARRGFTPESWWDDALDMADTGAMIRRPA